MCTSWNGITASSAYINNFSAKQKKNLNNQDDFVANTTDICFDESNFVLLCWPQTNRLDVEHTSQQTKDLAL